MQVELTTALILYFSGAATTFIALSAGFFYGKPWLDKRQLRIDAKEKLEITQKKASGA